MIVRPVIRKIPNRLILIGCALVLSAFQPVSKRGGDIILHDEPIPITPKEFYIANITDERDDKSAIAWLLPAAGSKDMPKAYPVDLQGGAMAAIKHYIAHNLPHNTALRPVTISLKKFVLMETALAGGSVEGHVALAMSFNLQQDDEIQHLVDYNGNIKYTRNPGPPQDIEPTLRQILRSGLIYFDTWMNRQANTNIKLAKTVTVTFTDHTENPEGDSIYYSPGRPITWDDFKGKPPQSKYDAEVYPFIGYDEHIEIDKGVIKLRLDIKVSLPKSACWVKDGNRNDYTLNHEQRHFDIAKIAAEHFKQKIRAENLPVANYDGPINVDYLDAYREMDSLQKQYDEETSHGTNGAAQERWNEKIDKELKGVGKLN